jgi:hypothetical protein
MPKMLNQLSEERVVASLRSLAKKRPVTGNNKEETSAIFYFFAASATAKECQVSFANGINLSAKSASHQRDTFLRYFRIFSQIGRTDKLINKLGTISSSAKSADYTARSNFLSTIIQRAANGPKGGIEYPARPRGGQIMIAGVTASVDRLAIRLHERWQSGLSKLLAGRESKTPWTDLCIILFRSYPINNMPVNLTAFLMEHSVKILDEETATFMTKALKAEEKALPNTSWITKTTGADPLEFTNLAIQAGRNPLEQAKLRIILLEEFIRSKGFDPSIVK